MPLVSRSTSGNATSQQRAVAFDPCIGDCDETAAYPRTYIVVRRAVTFDAQRHACRQTVARCLTCPAICSCDSRFPIPHSPFPIPSTTS
ncbi:hypothetical protein XAP412_950032 [Xanthomonas phaseoli pv. phaseoli]|uniref:Uncharacterized protein n=1 Tax=Xanthomonas campestris pv. phaseoli TaxID=317013 RepID=A0AB38E5Y9_XANCH|nr:hypothetical protein XAP6984_980032 [Xanthomonas phaseoli pv. phaseoli]SON91609.1 hypothetical protein XAP412_950032 [Xanthomonas phaseoli pv. phaseoli]SON93020.1 hypothetical protein XAP7430_970032 [Xanthomonas phaseoli pv. phaseoli]